MRSFFQKIFQSKPEANQTIYPGLNAAKGMLSLSIVLTHCLPPSMMLFFLYLFHMPLFLAISGFLLQEKAFENGYKYYIVKKWHKLVIPWLIASVMILPFRFADNTLPHIGFADIVYPYFHLWFIPAYIVSASVCYFISRNKIFKWPVIFITAVFTAVWYYMYRDTDVPSHTLPLFWLGDKRIFAYIFFFVMGCSLRNGWVKIKFTAFQLLLLLGIAFGMLAYFLANKFSSSYFITPYLIFNTSLLFLILIFVGPFNYFQHKVLLIINKHSLGIYLYHPIIIFSIFILINHKAQTKISHVSAVGVFILSILLSLGLVCLLKKWKFTNTYFLGNQKT